MGSADVVGEAYAKELRAAECADLTAVDNLGVVQVIWDDDDHPVQDRDGNILVMVTPSLMESSSTVWEKSFQLFLRETKEICEHAYRIIYIMSGFTSSTGWFSWWQWRLHTRVSAAHRANLKAVTIVHATLGMRVACGMGWMWFGSEFWNVVHFADRVEELYLDGVLTKEQMKRVLPTGVAAFEEMLVAEAEDARERSIAMGVPLMPRDPVATSPDSNQTK